MQQPDEQQKVNILLVDDNPTNLLALGSILEAPDRNLVRAASGEEALRYLLNDEVALILLDVFMPGIDGLETAALVRGREKSRDIPIIFLTADSTGGAYLSRGYSLGAVDYIVKPVDPAILKSKVAVFVELFRKTEEIKRQAALLHEKNIELENANLQRLGKLIELGQQLAAERDPNRLLEKFSHAALEIVGAKCAAVGLLDERGQTARFFPAGNSCSDRAEHSDLPHSGDKILGTLIAERRPLRLLNLNAEDEALGYLSRQPVIHSFLGAPILSPTQVFGWLYLADKTDAEEFNEADERLAVTLASQVAVAYENARLYTEVQHHATELAQEVTERKQAEKERAKLLIREQAARAEAEAANRMKDEFLATLSHELRTPLTAILGWSSLMRRSDLNGVERTRALETIERNAHAQSQLIDDLLDVSRIITGKLHLNTSPLQIETIVEAAIDSTRPAAAAKHLELQSSLADGNTPSFVSGDANRLQQVFWNLLTNAVKFTPEGGRIDLRLSRTPSHVEIIVSDTGLGVPPDFLPHIFDRFRQADGTTTRAHGGLGLGLAIARHLVELHGGTIQAFSEGVGRGAQFTVTLPLLAPQQKARAHRSATRVKKGSVSLNDRGLLDGLCVLVVEDERDTRELINTLLKRAGANVRSSDSVADALRTLATWNPDVLVSDIGMPGEDGYALIKKVRELEHSKDERLPAIALTAYVSVEDRSRVLAAGFQTHVAKPLDPHELLTVIAELAGKKATHDAH